MPSSIQRPTLRAIASSSGPIGLALCSTSGRDVRTICVKSFSVSVRSQYTHGIWSLTSAITARAFCIANWVKSFAIPKLYSPFWLGGLTWRKTTSHGMIPPMKYSGIWESCTGMMLRAPARARSRRVPLPPYDSPPRTWNPFGSHHRPHHGTDAVGRDDQFGKANRDRNFSWRIAARDSEALRFRAYEPQDPSPYAHAYSQHGGACSVGTIYLDQFGGRG